MIKIIETSIERIQGEKTCSVYTGERKLVNELRALKKKYPTEVELIDYGDGFVGAHVPYDWFKFIKPPATRNMTPEQRKAAADRLKKAREAKNR